jgi:hypothetical protein
MSGRKEKVRRRRAWGETRAFLRAFMEEIRCLFRRRAPAHYRRFPGARRPCETCAFRAWTDTDPVLAKGRESTAWYLLQALEQDAPFYCHDGFARGPDGTYQPPLDPREWRLCGGWSAVCADPLAKTAPLRAALQVRRGER